MLAIRLQRIGRSGHPMYRLAVQEAQRHPSSGRVIAYVGSYNPHTKETVIKAEDAQKYLDNGAQPTPRVVKLLEEAGVKLPKWVVRPAAQQKAVKSPEKLRKHQPKEEAKAEEAAAEAPAEATEAAADAE